jgi:NAD(P)-dependent dehydrogenase (short-subunit alcohol dehydrogenase family)
MITEQSMQDLEGKVAFITGGGSGAGLGQAKVFSEAGMKVVIADIRQDHIDEAMAYFRGKNAAVHAIKLDITDREAYKAAADEAERVWDWQMDVNVGGVVNGVMIFAARMIRRKAGGHIVIVSSMAAFRGSPGGGIYCTTKFAVRGLAESLRGDLEKEGIGVSLLCPAGINSNIHEAVLARPARYAKTGYYGADPERFKQLRRVIEGGMDPVDLAKHVLKAVKENRFWVLPYPETREGVERMHRELETQFARPEDDPDYEARKERQAKAFAAVRAEREAAAKKGAQ